jgi:hypothetical protein
MKTLLAIFLIVPAVALADRDPFEEMDRRRALDNQEKMLEQQERIANSLQFQQPVTTGCSCAIAEKALSDARTCWKSEKESQELITTALRSYTWYREHYLGACATLDRLAAQGVSGATKCEPFPRPALKPRR